MGYIKKKQLNKNRIYLSFSSKYAKITFEPDGIRFQAAEEIKNQKGAYYVAVKSGAVSLPSDIVKAYQFDNMLEITNPDDKKLLGTQLFPITIPGYAVKDKSKLPDKSKMKFIVKQKFSKNYASLSISKKVLSLLDNGDYSIIQHTGRNKFIEIRCGKTSSYNFCGELTSRPLGKSSISFQPGFEGVQIRWYQGKGAIYGFFVAKDEITKKEIDQNKDEIKSIHICSECADMKKEDNFDALQKLIELTDLVKTTNTMISGLKERLKAVEAENQELQRKNKILWKKLEEIEPLSF